MFQKKKYGKVSQVPEKVHITLQQKKTVLGTGTWKTLATPTMSLKIVLGALNQKVMFFLGNLRLRPLAYLDNCS